MSQKQSRKPPKVRGHLVRVHSAGELTDVIAQTLRLWRKAHLGYDQSKYVVEQVRRRLHLAPPLSRQRSVDRLDRAEVDRLIRGARRFRSYGKH